MRCRITRFEHVSRITGVDASAIEIVAAMLSPHQRIAYHAWSGVGQHTNATQTERAIATLYALTGAFDTQGSNRELLKQPANPLSNYAMLSPQQRTKALGLDERPLGPPSQGWVTAARCLSCDSRVQALSGTRPSRSAPTW